MSFSRQQLTKIKLEMSAERLSRDLAAFVHAAWPILEPVTELEWNWHLDLICEHLTAIKENRFREVFGQDKEGLIVNVPPRSMKSLLITVLFPVWCWASKPAGRWMFASYAEKLSTQHSTFRRTVIDSPWYQERWGKVFRFSKDQNLKTHYTNSKSGQMFATSMTGATGFGADTLILDDPMNPEEAFSETQRKSVNQKFDTVFRSRVNSPSSSVKIIVMQRLHEEDLTGHVLSKQPEAWVHVKLPATAETEQTTVFPLSGRKVEQKTGDLLWPERLPAKQLAGLKVGLGSWAYSGQFQQRPAPAEGGIIKKAWCGNLYKVLPARFDLMVQSWDCTFKDSDSSDFVAGQVWGKSGGRLYMLPYRTYERMDFGPTKAAIKRAHGLFPQAHAILIEDKANGSAIISELQHDISGIIPINPEGGKDSRAQSIAPLWEAGSVWLPDPQGFDVPWLEAYVHNICTFPKAAHDDDMDSTSQALIYIRHKMGGGIMEFYRRHAEAEQVSASIARGIVPKPGMRLPETRLTQAAKQAVGNYSRIDCHVKQYPEIRQALADVGTEFALTEIARLDEQFRWTTQPVM